MPNELWEWLDKIAPAGPRRRQPDPLSNLLGERGRATKRRDQSIDALEELLGIKPKKP
jgi:hypothetical protein